MLSVADEHYDFHTLLSDVPATRAAPAPAFQFKEVEVKGIPNNMEKELISRKLEELARPWLDY